MRFPPTGRMRPPGRLANVSNDGWAWNVAPSSMLTDITMVKLPSAFRRCAQTQMRPSESRASSARRYAAPLEVESKTLTFARGIQSPPPSQRHHWKYTSCSVDPEICGASNENTIATSIPTCTRSGVSRSQQASWIGAYQVQVRASSTLRYIESRWPLAPSCWRASSQVARLPSPGSRRTTCRAAGSVSALPPPTLMMFWGAATRNAVRMPNISPPFAEANVGR